jgi:5,10-methylenetetrahydrofolate reductase
MSSGKIDLIALDDGARGRDSLDNAIAAELLCGLGVDPSRLLANVVARNRHAEQLRKRLIHFAKIGVRNALLLTGDLPVEPGKTAKFPLDSVGL